MSLEVWCHEFLCQGLNLLPRNPNNDNLGSPERNTYTWWMYLIFTELHSNKKGD